MGVGTLSESVWVELTRAINKKISAEYHTTIELMKRPAQGDFHWYYKNINDYFNLGTFNYISTTVSSAGTEDVIEISGTRGYLNAYVSVLSDIEYVLGSRDSARLKKALIENQSQGVSVLNVYQSIYGKISEAEIETAQQEIGKAFVSTKLDYVIGYTLGYCWSGRQKAGKPPLTYDEMSSAKSLEALLKNMPSSGAQVVPVVVGYLNGWNLVNRLQEEVNAGNRVLKSLKRNTTHPSAENGGAIAVDPIDGATSEIVSYTVTPSIAEIHNTLTDPNRVLTINIPPSKKLPKSAGSDEKSSKAERYAPFLHFSLGSKGQDPAISTLADPTFELTKIGYPGYLMVGIDPEAWRVAGKKGWFLPDPITEAIRNYGKDTTGYVFTQLPSYTMGLGERGRRLCAELTRTSDQSATKFLLQH